ncbi:twin-arginine translocation signal domain-containing protein [Cupriavidus sp. 30B13]|uniref:twin-arginine translocation signal domain-containing protein n=1 Tax=Cupriavidus sp. 30B13 TaxID=3384241 RepID=UPI003B8EBBCE
MQTIPISPLREDGGVAPRKALTLTRRSLLKGTGVLIGTLAVGSPLALLAPSTVWAVELKTLSAPEGDTLLQMGRVLFPHDKLPDAVYALLAKDLDQAATADAQVARQLRDGIAALNQQAGGSFVKADAGRRLAAVKALEGQPFFDTVRGKCVTSLYDNEMAFAAFGYPGSAWEKGGYIMRGFQDLKWLPEPPATASPAPDMG